MRLTTFLYYYISFTQSFLFFFSFSRRLIQHQTDKLIVIDLTTLITFLRPLCRLTWPSPSTSASLITSSISTSLSGSPYTEHITVRISFADTWPSPSVSFLTISNVHYILLHARMRAGGSCLPLSKTLNISIICSLVNFPPCMLGTISLRKRSKEHRPPDST